MREAPEEEAFDTRPIRIRDSKGESKRFKQYLEMQRLINRQARTVVMNNLEKEEIDGREQ